MLRPHHASTIGYFMDPSRNQFPLPISVSWYLGFGASFVAESPGTILSSPLNCATYSAQYSDIVRLQYLHQNVYFIIQVHSNNFFFSETASTPWWEKFSTRSSRIGRPDSMSDVRKDSQPRAIHQQEIEKKKKRFLLKYFSFEHIFKYQRRFKKKRVHLELDDTRRFTRNDRVT